MPTTHERLRRGLVPTLALTAVASTAVATLGLAGPNPSSVAADQAPKAPRDTATATDATKGATKDAAEERRDGGRTDSRRPNVLLVTLDDAAYGDFRYMPFTRQLVADQGVTMENFISPNPICVPSRASTLTGDYSHNHGLVTVGGPQGLAPTFADSGANRQTVATWLDRAGYDTYTTGKWMNGYEVDLPASASEPGWDRWEPATIDTYQFFDTQFFEQGTEVGSYGEYNTYAITDRATDYIRSRKRDRDPWFAWVNYVAPHHGEGDLDPNPSHYTTVPAPEDTDRFEGIALRRQPNMFHAAKGSYGAGRGRVSPELREDMRYAFEQRVQALQAVDRGIRDQVNALRRSHQLDNTYVIVTSDNGYEVGEHNHEGKLLPYRDSLMVPTVLRGPGVPKDKVVDTVASVPDLAVTIASIGRAAPPSRTVDGTNFLPMLDSEKTLYRAIPIVGYPLGTTRERPLYYGVVRGSTTYVRWAWGKEEMYDTRIDPYQIRNLASEAGYHDRLVELRKLARQLRDCRGNSCPKEYAAAPSAG